MTHANDTPLLRAAGIVKEYPGQRTSLRHPPAPVRVLDNVTVTLGRDETVAIIGESGSGKSTLVRIMLGLSRATAGVVHFDGAPLPTRRRELSELRRRSGVVLQDPYASLNPRKTIGWSIAEPLVSLGIDVDRPGVVREILERVGLDPDRADDYPHQLSGGQRQRVAIARAIVHGPDVLVGDEPLSALDVTIRASILNLLRELRAERSLSLILVSHDLGLVEHFADRVYVLKDGVIVEEGPADSVLTRPTHEYTRKLVAAVPRLPTS